MKRKVMLVTSALVALASLASAQSTKSAAPKSTPTGRPMPGATTPERWLPVDKDGWTILKPSPDSQIMYVSNAEGNDATAQVYQAGDEAVGGDATRPRGPIRSFRTIAAAMAKVRNEYPDWVLLKRGDTWEDQNIVVESSGRSAGEPRVVGAYGTSPTRPVLLGKDSQTSITVGRGTGTQYVVVTGIELHQSFMDPDSPNYHKGAWALRRDQNENNKSVVLIWSGKTTGTNPGIKDILVEDCMLRFSQLICKGDALMTNVVFRRNLVLDHYSPNGHTMGFAGVHASILLEECIFDHCGWLLQRVPANDGKKGKASMKSHNTYFPQMYSTIFRDNVFLRASSIHNKFTCNVGSAGVKDVWVDNNLYVEGEICVGMGGNTPGPLRWVNCKILNNVMLDIGRSQPTGRNLAWYIFPTDWDGGEIAGNLFLRQRSKAVTNVIGLKVYCGVRPLPDQIHTRNLLIRGNVFHGLNNAAAALIIKDPHHMKNITFADNMFQFTDVPSTLVATDALSPELKFRNNIYDSAAAPETWFMVGEKPLSFEQWVKESGEQGGRKEKIKFPDPERGIEAYMKSLGKEPSFDAFIAEVRKQSKSNWRKEFTAPVVNDWIREGFGVQKTAASPVEGGNR